MAEDPELWHAIDRLTRILAQEFDKQYIPLELSFGGAKDSKCDASYSVEGSGTYSSYENDTKSVKDKVSSLASEKKRFLDGKANANARISVINKDKTTDDKKKTENAENKDKLTKEIALYDAAIKAIEKFVKSAKSYETSLKSITGALEESFKYSKALEKSNDKVKANVSSHKSVAASYASDIKALEDATSAAPK